MQCTRISCWFLLRNTTRAEEFAGASRIFNGLWQVMSAKECCRTWDVYVAGSEYSMAMASDECQRMLEDVGRVCCRIRIFNGYSK